MQFKPYGPPHVYGSRVGATDPPIVGKIAGGVGGAMIGAILNGLWFAWAFDLTTARDDTRILILGAGLGAAAGTVIGVHLGSL